MYKPKLTIVDSELRDIFAGLVAAGIAQSYVNSEEMEEDKDDIARLAYEISDSLIKRRRLNKERMRGIKD